MSNTKRRCIRKWTATMIFAAMGAASPAFADRIDGDWCSAKGERLSINGPTIVTPGGASLPGRYDRHNFSYTVPVPEKHAGATVTMSQQNEQTMLLRRSSISDGKSGAVLETWKRCEATS